MCNKNACRKMFFTAVAVCGFPFPVAHACSVWDVPGLTVDGPLSVMMIDGADRNSTVKVKVRIDHPKKSGFDFGFVGGASYTPITGKSRVRGSYIFAGGAVVDFALRNWGSDHVFGTADDHVYSLSDGASRQYYFAPVVSSRYRDPKATPGDFQELRIDWDPDHDGKTDLETWIEVKRSRYDGIVPAIAPVPVPSTMWLFGSGLLGLAGALMRRKELQV